MTRFELHYPPGATPIDPDELDGLIPDYITTRGELNELEQENIQEAILWLREQKTVNITDAGFLFELHRRMFNRVWKWAGRLRKSGKNIGVDWTQITTQVNLLLGDVRYWVEGETFPMNEIATRFHHRLVQIHIFPNGNGRHARLVTDLFLELNDQEPFTWGSSSSKTPLEAAGVRRSEYIAALRSADQNNYVPLLEFVRT